MWVAVWLRRIAERRSSSMVAVTTWPASRPPEPEISWTWIPGTPYRVSVTSIVTPPPVTVPVSPIWPPTPLERGAVEHERVVVDVKHRRFA